MKTHRKHILFLTFMLIFVMACRIYSCDGPATLITLDQELISCHGYTTDKFNGGSTCTFSCPDGSKISADVPEDSIKGQFISYSLEVLQQQYCPADSFPTEEPTQAPADAPTDAPTQEATEAPTQPPLQPYLTGSVTACDLTNRFINFTIAENAPAVQPSSLNVTLGGQPLNCSTPASNPGILTCTFAPEASFPAQVSLSIDGVEVNNFSFDGGICAFNDPPPPLTTEEAPPPTDPCAGVLTPTPSCP